MRVTTKSGKFPAQAKRASTRRTPANRKARGKPVSFNEEFKEFIGIIKDGPSDLARNHKLYASGAKKWK